MYATNCGLASSWIPSLEEDGKVKDLPVSLSALRGSVLALHKSAPQQRRGTQLTLDAHLVVPERPGLLPVAAHAEAPLDGAEPDHSEALPARATPPLLCLQCRQFTSNLSLGIKEACFFVFPVFNAVNSLATHFFFFFLGIKEVCFLFAKSTIAHCVKSNIDMLADPCSDES